MTTDELTIDGAHGEGGGQIIRSSLALALVTGRAFTIERIRANREKPGLMKQHLTAVNAAVEICGGTVVGAELRSQRLRFEPAPVRAGNYRFSVGTAGSATLVLQTVLPALLNAAGRSELILEGGTHNEWAPPFEFLAHSFLPLVNKMGPRVTAKLERGGFYPAGGGRFTVSIEPSETLRGFDLLQRGDISSRAAYAILANLPLHVGEREVKTMLRKMEWEESCGSIRMLEAHGAGNAAIIEIGSSHVTEVFTGFGKLGVKAERVAEAAVREAREYLASNAVVGTHLADQIMLPFALGAWQRSRSPRARGGSFLTLPLTDHSTTQIDILKRFLEIEIRVQSLGDTCRVDVGGMA